MSRLESVRQAALKRDGYRCQITGKPGPQVGGDNPIEVDHWRELGMGGSDARDVVENMITLYKPIHQLKTEKKFSIEKWDPDNGILEIGDATHHIITHDEKALNKLFGVSRLWFYQRQLAEELQPVEAMIQGIHQVDGQIAQALYRLWEDDNYRALDPEAKSFRDYSESRGWDTARAVRLVNLYRRAQELGLEWPARMTATDFRRELRNAGKIKSRAFWYVIFTLGYEDPIKLVRSNSEDELVEGLKPYQVAVRVGKFFGLQAKDGKLLDRGGNPVNYPVLAETDATTAKQT